MRAYLNICYAWGDVCLILAYYSPDIESIAAKVEDSDYSLCNLVYLHNYLSREQWCIIAQRITNFGEVHCKYVMVNRLICIEYFFTTTCFSINSTFKN